MPYHEEKLPPFPSHIKVTTINDFPYSEIINVNGTLVGRGICFEFFQALVKKYNFTYTIVPPEKDVIGNQTTGMIKQLYNKEVDMAVSFIPIIGKLREFVEFGDVIDEMDEVFLSQRPGTSATGTGLFAPFSERVWWMILFSIFVIGPAIYVIVNLRKRFAECVGAERFTFFMCLWFSYGALVKQGTIVAPTGDSVRLVFATWWIFITILSAFYTANLTAFFTLNKFTLYVTSLKDLLWYRYYFFVIDGRSTATMIEYDDVDVEPLITLHKWRYSYFSTDYNMTYQNMLKLTNEGRFHIVDRTLAMLAIEEDYKNETAKGTHENFRCKFAITDNNILPKTRSFAFAKGSVLRKYFRYDMMAALENGYMHHYRTKRTKVSQVCPLDLHLQERQLKISDLYVTFKTCFYGYCGALCLLVLEVIVWLYNKFVNLKAIKLRLTKVGQIKGTDAPPVGADKQIVDGKPEKTNEKWTTRTPPPTYEASAGAADKKTFSINGREYDVVREETTGDQRLIAAKSPSSYLFQYIH